MPLETIVWIFLSLAIVSSISLLGVFTLSLRREFVQRITLYLVSFAVGALFGGAFFHLIPEAYEQLGYGPQASLLIVTGILIFFVLEKFLRWRHCHVHDGVEHNHAHPFVTMNLIGDGMHNLIDGILIAASYMSDTHAGIVTTLAVLLHEIPQEIGDFGVLLHGGLGVRRALLLNFLSALLAFAGAGLVILGSEWIEGLSVYLLPITAGGFLYIAGSDLIPELQHDAGLRKSAFQFVGIAMGLACMLMLGIWLGHEGGHAGHAH